MGHRQRIRLLGTSGPNLWTSAVNQDKTVWIWQQIVARYKEDSFSSRGQLRISKLFFSGFDRWSSNNLYLVFGCWPLKVSSVIVVVSLTTA